MPGPESEPAVLAARQRRKVRQVQGLVLLGSMAVIWGMQWLQEHFLDGIEDEGPAPG